MTTQNSNEALLKAGRALANCAYNLAHDERLPEWTRESLDEARKAWDHAALTASPATHDAGAVGEVIDELISVGFGRKAWRRVARWEGDAPPFGTKLYTHTATTPKQGGDVAVAWVVFAPSGYPDELCRSRGEADAYAAREGAGWTVAPLYTAARHEAAPVAPIVRYGVRHTRRYGTAIEATPTGPYVRYEDHVAALAASPGAEQAPAVGGGDAAAVMAEAARLRGHLTFGAVKHGTTNDYMTIARPVRDDVVALLDRIVDVVAAAPAPAVERYCVHCEYLITTPPTEARDPGAEQGDAGVVDWRELYRFQSAMRYMDNHPKLSREKAYAMADEDVASLERAALAARAPHTNSGAAGEASDG